MKWPAKIAARSWHDAFRAVACSRGAGGTARRGVASPHRRYRAGRRAASATVSRHPQRGPRRVTQTLVLLGRFDRSARSVLPSATTLTTPMASWAPLMSPGKTVTMSASSVGDFGVVPQRTSTSAPKDPEVRRPRPQSPQRSRTGALHRTTRCGLRRARHPPPVERPGVGRDGGRDAPRRPRASMRSPATPSTPTRRVVLSSRASYIANCSDGRGSALLANRMDQGEDPGVCLHRAQVRDAERAANRARRLSWDGWESKTSRHPRRPVPKSWASAAARASPWRRARIA